MAKERLTNELKSLTMKQQLAIIAAIAVSLILAVIGLASSCLGILIIAVILYMIPHLLGIHSVRIKTVIGVAFIVLAILVGTLGYGAEAQNITGDYDDEAMSEPMIWEDENGYYLTIDVNPAGAGLEYGDGVTDWDIRVGYSDSTMVAFGQLIGTSGDRTTVTVTSDGRATASRNEEETEENAVLMEGEGGWYSLTLRLSNLSDGEYEYVQIVIDSVSSEGVQTVLSSVSMTYDTGISSGSVYLMMFKGTALYTLEIALFFFVILGFATYMRKGATKSRQRMEAEGRLYPQGYGRCKQCGTMVLPGEVVCRKCGTYIDVPDEMRAKKKDFVTCSECGAEVPADAETCPRCGAAFDETEYEISHADGTTDVTSETIPCPHCGKEIPSNADWCSHCGKKVTKNV